MQSLYEFIFCKGFIAGVICTSSAPVQVLDLKNLDITLAQAGLDQPCVLIVQDSHEDLLQFLEADDQVQLELWFGNDSIWLFI